MAPGPPAAVGPLDLHDPTHPAPPWSDHPSATQRPRSSYLRFEAEQPNECWQSDFTHWALADGTDTEILNWLDDHSRYLMACTAYHRVAGPRRGRQLTHTAARHGLPASTLTDNGSVYTSRFTHGHNDFERLIASLGITEKNGHPGHPQTQGKIERFRQTLKRWLTPPHHHQRPTDDARRLARPLQHPTPTPRPSPQTHPRRPTSPAPKPLPHHQRRTLPHPPDTVDQFGKLTLRYGSRLHHLGIGITHAHTPVVILITTTTVTVISKPGHHLIASHHIDPNRNYWSNQQKTPADGRGNP